ncbi:hypothetical protein R3P38DRAFT_2526141, partial [Favolaschia claudopus]
QRVKETLGKMVDHVKSFVKIGKLRRKEETTATLQSYFEEASTLNTKAKVRNMRTASGIKDTFQLVFIERLFDSYKGKRGKKAKQEALEAKLRTLPQNTTSPVWQIKGLDPHQDTPVEILHVILLGFVKYMWRDLVQNQLKNKEDQKKLLETRLNSFNVQGLGIPPLAGRTLVQYFRAIAQAAPFVVYDLVSPDCLATWVALSKLIPLIWQPQIKDVDAHILLLTAEIDYFMTCAARWTTRWFNKPKFHILLHLPAHIRRFGPAILFATEAFESFNAIIRAKSAFAQGNRIRHLLSGGCFMEAEPILSSDRKQQTVPRTSCLPSRTAEAWKCAASGPLSLVSSASTIAQYIGLEPKKTGSRGICVSDKLPARPFSETLTGIKLPGALTPSRTPQMIQTSSLMYLDNGDPCALQQFVIVRRPDLTTFIARVVEILQVKPSPEFFSQHPSAILLQQATVASTTDSCYGMPALELKSQWFLVKMADILCAVNVQHNCSVQGCGATGFRYVYQERERSNETRPVIVHAGLPADLVLNTAQMRDAVNLQPYRVNSERLDADTIIKSFVLREFDLRKAANAVAAGAQLTEIISDGRLGSSEVEMLAGSSTGKARGNARARGKASRARGRGINCGNTTGGRLMTARITELQVEASSST